jgi:ABC-type molybdate transport system substrate-binding protein
MAGLLKKTPHAQAGKDFMQFLKRDTAKAIYR